MNNWPPYDSVIKKVQNQLKSARFVNKTHVMWAVSSDNYSKMSMYATIKKMKANIYSKRPPSNFIVKLTMQKQAALYKNVCVILHERQMWQ